jgi:release factor glutamine methyltransferase
MKKTDLYKIWREQNIESKKIEQILLKTTELTKSQLFLIDEIDEKYLKDIKNSFYRLSNWEPLEYIIKNAEFYSLNFYVDSRVLIPRDDTEIIVDKAINTIINYKSITLIDVGTWSSCIPISIIKNTIKVNNCYVIDISKNALEVSKKNIINHNLEKKIKQINWDLLKNILSDNSYDLKKNVIITANLPYIKNNDFENIDKETIQFEPALALYWWKNTWFELYEKLIDQSINLKKIKDLNSLTLFIEIWFDQKEYSEKYLNNLNLKFNTFKDNNWINRCIKIEF